MSSSNDLYRSYGDWKGWTGTHDLRRVGPLFQAELDRAKLAPPAAILEIGFGNGDFLVWAKQRGYQVSGLEIGADFVARAQAEGFRVWHGTLDAVELGDERFDAIVAFDVLEHLEKKDLVAFFERAHGLLSPAGLMIARTPNAASPFGMWSHAADLTHVTLISPEAIRHLAAISGFDVVFAGNSARDMRRDRGLVRYALKMLSYGIRDFLELFLGQVHFGRRVPMDSNMIAILRRKS
jgi:2-polyprenyl-3-methyl-5-hydroxy-6-metoxy-1,4-benzoquinol methylase